MRNKFVMRDGKLTVEVPVESAIIQIPEKLERGRNYIARMEPLIVRYGKKGPTFLINWRILRKGEKPEKQKLKAVK